MWPITQDYRPKKERNIGKQFMLIKMQIFIDVFFFHQFIISLTMDVFNWFIHNLCHKSDCNVRMSSWVFLQRNHSCVWKWRFHVENNPLAHMVQSCTLAWNIQTKDYKLSHITAAFIIILTVEYDILCLYYTKFKIKESIFVSCNNDIAWLNFYKYIK